MTFTPVTTYLNSPSTATPLSAANLNASFADVASYADTILTPVRNGIDLNIRDYVGLDPGGTLAMDTIINAASLAAKAVAVAGGYPYATLGGFGRGVYRIDNPLLLRDKVRFRLDEARIVAGANFTTPTLTTGMFRAFETSNAPVGQGTALTTNASYILTSVSAPTLWTAEDRITGTGIPVGAKVVAVDVLNSRIIMDAAATATATVTITKDATYYGNYRNAGIIGGELDPNGFAVGAIIRALWTEGFRLDGVRLLHNRGAAAADWATQLGGRNMLVNNLTITGGGRVLEDGFHFVHGQHLRVNNLNIEGTGDDALALGGEVVDATLAASPDPIRHVTVNGAAVHSHRGFAVSIYCPNTGTGRDWEVSDIEVRGVVGEAGVLRNGGIRVVDLNAGAAGTTQIRRVNINGVKLVVGGRGHDDVQAHVIWVTSASDVTVSNFRASVTEGEGTATGFDFANVAKSEDVTLDNIGCASLPRRFALDVSASSRVMLKNSKLTQNLVTPFSNVPIRLISCPDFGAFDNEFTGLRTGQPMVSCTTGTGTTMTFRGNTPKPAAASTGYAFDLAPAAVTKLVAVENDFSSLTGIIATPANLPAGSSIRRNTGTADVVPTVASAAALTLPQDSDFVLVSGTSAITSIVATGHTGRTVTLTFNGTAGSTGLTAGSNLKIPANFVYTANDSYTLSCDGTNWLAAGAGSVNP